MDGAEAARVVYGQEDGGSNGFLKALTRPWEKGEIKWRIGSLSKDKKKALPLAYIDARTVMERLDAAVGGVNWQDRYEFHEKRTICYLSIRINGEWICKADGAGDSDIEGEKGGISDAFKRASVKWGMGRELYELKCGWMPINEYKQLVGDPWSFVIKGATEDEPEPKYNPEHDYNECLAQINEAVDKDVFRSIWNALENKQRRVNIKNANPVLYASILSKQKLLLDNFTAAEAV